VLLQVTGQFDRSAWGIDSGWKETGWPEPALSETLRQGAANLTVACVVRRLPDSYAGEGVQNRVPLAR
jgi:hypothetical protein